VSRKARERLTLGLLLTVAFGSLMGSWVLPPRGAVIDHYDQAYSLIVWSLGVSLGLMLLTSPFLGVFRHSFVLALPPGLLEAEGLLFVGTTVVAGWTASRNASGRAGQRLSRPTS